MNIISRWKISVLNVMANISLATGLTVFRLLFNKKKILSKDCSSINENLNVDKTACVT